MRSKFEETVVGVLAAITANTIAEGIPLAEKPKIPAGDPTSGHAHLFGTVIKLALQPATRLGRLVLVRGVTAPLPAGF